jgi:O-antigen/teichoic acid export membrane protein
LTQSEVVKEASLRVAEDLSGPPVVVKKTIGGRVRGLFGGRETWALADQALVSGTNFLTNIVLARMIGLDAFGAFSFAWMAVLFMNGYQNALIISPMMSIRPKVPQSERSQYLGALLVHEGIFAAVSSSILGLALLVAFSYLHRPLLKDVSLALSGATLCYLLQDFLRRYLFATARSGAAFFIDSISYLPQVPIIWFIARRTYLPTSGALWIVAATSAVGIIVGILVLEKFSFRYETIVSVAKQHWKLSRWLVPSATLNWTSNNLFLVAAPLYFGAVAAGVLRASQNIVGVAHIWFLGLDNVVPAEAARQLHESGLDASLAYIKRIIFTWGGLTLLFVATVSIAPNALLHLVYGAKYESYGHLLRLYGLLYGMVFFGFPLQAMLKAFEVTSPIFLAYAVMSGFSVLFAVPFVRWFGLDGVILGSIGTQLIFLSILITAVIRKVQKLRQAALIT